MDDDDDESLAIGDELGAPTSAPSAKKPAAAATNSMQDATGIVPVVNQMLGVNHAQLEKVLLQVELPIRVKSHKQVDHQVTPNGEYLRLVFPRTTLASDQQQVFDILREGEVLHPKDLATYEHLFETFMKKRRKFKEDTVYEVCYIKLVKAVDPMVPPVSQLMVKRMDGSLLFLELHVPSDAHYESGKKKTLMV